MKVNIIGKQQEELITHCNITGESPTNVIRDLLQDFLNTIEKSQLAESNHDRTDLKEKRLGENLPRGHYGLSYQVHR